MDETDALLKGEALKQEVMRVAKRHFALKGFAATNIDEIADELGISKPSIYYHFGKKEALFDAVIGQSMEQHARYLQHVMKTASDPVDALRIFVLSYAENLFGENRYLTNLMMQKLANDDLRNLPKETLMNMEIIRGMFWKILDDGEKQGLFRSYNRYVLFNMIIGFISIHVATEPGRERILAEQANVQVNEMNTSLTDAVELLYEMMLRTLRLD